MNILCSIHLYPPQHLCGAEMMIHRVNKFLQSKGHEVKVLLNQANHYKIKSVYCYDGVDVFPPEQITIDSLFYWADVVFTHLDYTNWTIQISKIYKKPVVHFVHNTHPYPSIINAESPQYIVYNSEHSIKKLGYKHKGIVLHPPTDYRKFEIDDPEKNEYITLINANRNKGAHIFYRIAERLPEFKFLVVKGSYDQQLTGDIIEEEQINVEGLVKFFDVKKTKPTPKNVTLIDKSLNILDVYKQTRILLMPSEYESWGMTMTEAMSCGIPVISTKTDGLLENGAKAGIYIDDRENLDDWCHEILKLSDKKHYKKVSKACKKRAIELDPIDELEKFNKWLNELH